MYAIEAMQTDLPPPGPDWCLFLDFDGTLVEIAEAPDAIRVERMLSTTLQRVTEALGGAVAIVSGRPIAEIDSHIDHGSFAAAGLHGLEMRHGPGRPVARVQATPPGPGVHAVLSAFCALHPGLILENKGAAIALHYRARPELAGSAVSAAHRAIAGHAGLHVLRGKMVVEVKSAVTNKGDAVRVFMEELPFAGRTPVFAGDDLTDEDGFAAAAALGGFGIKIGDGETSARWRIGTVARFLDWLATLPGRIGSAAGEVARQ